MKNILNMMCFQLGWWVCIIGVKNNLIYLGPVFMFTYIFLHLFFMSNYKNEFMLIIFGSFIGIIVDGYFKYSHMINYLGDFNNSILPPIWIIFMWSGFCTTINHSLNWLNKSIFLSFLLGFIFGPLSYLLGQKLGVISFATNIQVISNLSLIWGLSIPFLFYVNKKLKS